MRLWAGLKGPRKIAGGVSAEESNFTRAFADMKISGFRTKVVSVPRERGPLGEGVDSLASNFVTLRLTTDD